MARDVDVVVIGDGPAGSALASACTSAGTDVVLVGPDAPWEATYAGWGDDAALGVLGADVVGFRVDGVAAWTDRRHLLDREYVILDNDRLRAATRAGSHVVASVDQVAAGTRRHLVDLDDGSELRARLVVDATGWPARFAVALAEPGRGRPRVSAWQTAFGVVFDEPIDGTLGEATFMDFRPVPGTEAHHVGGEVPTFCYAVPVHDGWLVEETVLAARPAVAPSDLRGRLATRLGIGEADLLDRARRVEEVRIPMGGPRPRLDQPIVAFGAAAGMINPVTGYSVLSSIKAAPSVAASIGDSLTATSSSQVADPRPVWDAVWPADRRRTRALHDYGLDTLSRLSADDIRSFFGTFFDLPVHRWSAYLDSDRPPTDVASTMFAMFRSSSWRTRRRLAAGNWLSLARVFGAGRSH